MGAVKKFLAGLAAKLLSSGDAAERRHEREMSDRRAFEAGKIPPSYLARYAAVLLFAFLGCLVIVEAAWPDAIPGSPWEAIHHVADLAAGLLRSVFGM